MHKSGKNWPIEIKQNARLKLKNFNLKLKWVPGQSIVYIHTHTYTHVGGNWVNILYKTKFDKQPLHEEREKHEK